MSKTLKHARMTVGEPGLSGRTTVKLRAYTPKADNPVEIEMSMDEWQLNRLAKEIRDALRELSAKRQRADARNLAIYNDAAR
jgi:hypothetical protein